MSRKEELLQMIGDSEKIRNKASRLIDEIVFIEEKMQSVKGLPFIEVNKKNPCQQRATSAAKLYKELMQQYNNSLRLLFRLSGDIGEDSEEDTPLRAWLKAKKNEMECR